jgi:hypothetical protein
MRVIRPNENLEKQLDEYTVFLAGNMSKPWRKEVIKALENLPITIFDPTVEDWETKIGEESIDNEKWVAQTDWENNGLAYADLKAFYFSEGSAAPASMLELGCYKAKGSKQTIVCAEDGYEKASYVKYIARRFDLIEAKSLKELIELIKIQYALNI